MIQSIDTARASGDIAKAPSRGRSGAAWAARAPGGAGAARRAGRARVALLAGLLAGALAGAGATAEALLDAEAARAWRGVGRLNVAGMDRRRACTGALVAPDLVLTAAHCVVHPATGQPFPPGTVHFVAGWHQGKATGHSRAAAIAIDPGWPGTVGPGEWSTEVLAADLALVRLAEPLAPEAATPFATARPPEPGTRLILIGYRRDRAHALTRQDDCAYAALVSRVLVLDCAVVEGASGSPVFAEIEGEARIVGVLSAAARAGPARAFVARAHGTVERLMPLLGPAPSRP